jgi:hypothetical protein
MMWRAYPARPTQAVDRYAQSFAELRDPAGFGAAWGRDNQTSPAVSHLLIYFKPFFLKLNGIL